MSQDLALSLLEELLRSQQSLLSEVNELTVQIELSDTVEINLATSAHAGH